MAEKLRQWPPSILRRWLSLLAIGLLCLLVGGVTCIVLADTKLLKLSGAVSLLVAIRAVMLYRLVSKQNYDTLEGVCIQVAERPLQKKRKAKLMEADGKIRSILLEKRFRLQVGYQYRLYYIKGSIPADGSRWFQDSMLADSLLGFEELGECNSQEGLEKTPDEM